MRQSTHELFQMSDKQFDQVYRQVLEPELKRVEEQRKQTFMFLGVVWLVTAVIGIASLRGGVLFFLFAAGIIGALSSMYFINRYGRAYKEVVIPALLKHAGTDLYYTAQPDYSVDSIKQSNTKCCLKDHEFIVPSTLAKATYSWYLLGHLV